MHHSWLIPLSIDGHLGGLYWLAITNKAVLNIHEQVFSDLMSYHPHVLFDPATGCSFFSPSPVSLPARPPGLPCQVKLIFLLGSYHIMST